MRRLFLSLYAVVAAALVGFGVTVPWLFGHVLGSELRRGGEQIAVAAQSLFDEELRHVPAAGRPAHIEALKTKFGYDLSLLTLRQVNTSKQNLQRLRQGQPVPSDADRVDYLLLPIRGSDYVVKVYLEQQQQEHVRRTAQGFYYLLEQRLARQQGVPSADVLRRIEKQIGITVRSVGLDTFSTDADRVRLLAGEILGKDVDSPAERYFKLIAGSERVMQVGPFPHSFVERAIGYLAVIALAIIVALALYLWVKPLWRDMLALDQGALTVSFGQLDGRVEVSPRSPVRVLANTFNTMAQRVPTLLKSQKEMADAVSHELRTPISRLRFGVEMLERSPPGADRDRYMSSVLGDIEELECLVDEALTYSRLTYATGRASVQEVDLAAWLAGIVSDARRSAGSIAICSEIATPDTIGCFDPRLMGRALSNVIRNALRYARSAVRITIDRGENSLDLIVEDDGPGIPHDERTAIFEPFHRVDPARQRGSGGHGLGLAIVKRICEQHEAEVLVEDSALAGALFRLRLPAQSASFP